MSLTGNFPYLTYIRAYEPLHLLPEPMQSRIMGESQAVPEDIVWMEAHNISQLTLREVVDPYPRLEHELFRRLRTEGTHGSVDFYSPNQMHMRAGMASSHARDELPTSLVDSVLPEASTDEYQIRSSSMPEEHQLFTLSKSWGVPLEWFVPFAPDDLELVERTDTGTVRNVHRFTTRELALNRVKRAVAAIAVATPETPVLENLSKLAKWLEQFSADAWIELEYGAVSQWVYPDDSVEDVRDWVEAFVDEDEPRRLELHIRLVLRWQHIWQKSRAS